MTLVTAAQFIRSRRPTRGGGGGGGIPTREETGVRSATGRMFSSGGGGSASDTMNVHGGAVRARGLAGRSVLHLTDRGGIRCRPHRPPRLLPSGGLDLQHELRDREHRNAGVFRLHWTVHLPMDLPTLGAGSSAK